MSREDIIRMAREAKIEFDHDGSNSFVFSIDQFERFASLVAAAKQEECAKVCDEESELANMQANEGGRALDDGRAIGAEACAAAIRAL